MMSSKTWSYISARLFGGHFTYDLGTQRRTKKVVTAKTEVNVDKKFNATIKKFGKYEEYWSHLGMQPLSDIDEVNMFKDDNTVIHFRKP